MFNNQIFSNNLLEDESYDKLIDDVMKVDYKAFYRGTVVDNDDPMKMGRVRVRVPQIYGAEVQKDDSIYVPSYSIPWASSAIMTGAGNNTGAYLIPNIGDTVLITFEGGDPNLPLYFGGLLTRDGKDKFIGTKDANNDMLYAVNSDDFNTDITNGSQRVIYKSLKGATIIIDDKDEDESIKIIDQLGQFISLENVSNEALGRDRLGGVESKARSGRIVIKDAYEDSVDLHNGEIHIKTPRIVIETDEIKQIGYDDSYPEEVDYAERILGDEEEEPVENVTWYFNILGIGDNQGHIYVYDDDTYYDTPVSITRPDGTMVDVDFSCSGYQTLSTNITFDKEAEPKETIVTLEPIPVEYGDIIINNDTDLPILVGIIYDVDNNYQELTEFNNISALYPNESVTHNTVYDVDRVFSISVVRYDLYAKYNYFISFDDDSTTKTIYASDILANGCYYSNARVITYDPEVEGESSHYNSLIDYGKMELINNATGETYYNILRSERAGYNNYDYACFSFGSVFTFFWNYDTITRDPEREDFIDYVGFYPMTYATRGINIDLSSDTPFKMMVPIKNGIYTCNLISSDGTINNQSTLYVFGPNDNASSYKSDWNIYASKSATYFMPISRDVNTLSTIYNKQIFVPGTYQYTGESPVIIQNGYYNYDRLGYGISFGNIRPLQSSTDYARCITIYAGVLGPSGELDENFRCMYAGNWFSPLTTSASPQATSRFFKPRGVLVTEEIERQLTFFYTYETYQPPQQRSVEFVNDLVDLGVSFGVNFHDFTDDTDFDCTEFESNIKLAPSETYTVTVDNDSGFNSDYFMVTMLGSDYVGKYNNLISWSGTNMTLYASDFLNGNISYGQQYLNANIELVLMSDEEKSQLIKETTILTITNQETGEVFKQCCNSDGDYAPSTIRPTVRFMNTGTSYSSYYNVVYNWGFKPYVSANFGSNDNPNCYVCLPQGHYTYSLSCPSVPTMTHTGSFVLLGQAGTYSYTQNEYISSKIGTHRSELVISQNPMALQNYNYGNDSIQLYVNGSTENLEINHSRSVPCGYVKAFLSFESLLTQNPDYTNYKPACRGLASDGWFASGNNYKSVYNALSQVDLSPKQCSFFIDWYELNASTATQITDTVTVDITDTAEQDIGNGAGVLVEMSNSGNYSFVRKIKLKNNTTNKALVYSIVAKYKNNTVVTCTSEFSIGSYKTFRFTRVVFPGETMELSNSGGSSGFSFDSSDVDLVLEISGTRYSLGGNS